MSKIYTKTGDKGNTALIGGKTVSKDSLQVEAYGNVDELKSYISLLIDLADTDSICDNLKVILIRLFDIESLIASANVETMAKMPTLSEKDVLFLENSIDKMSKSLPQLKSFVLPGGHIFNSHCNIARTVCRRTERSCIRFWNQQPELFNPIVEKYLNRLSDYLFTLSRFWNNKNNIPEALWLPKK